QHHGLPTRLLDGTSHQPGRKASTVWLGLCRSQSPGYGGARQTAYSGVHGLLVGSTGGRGGGVGGGVMTRVGSGGGGNVGSFGLTGTGSSGSDKLTPSN